MWRYRLRYVILLTLSFLLYIFYAGYLSYFIFVCMLALPFISLLFFICAIYGLRIELSNKQPLYYKLEASMIQLQTHTNSFIPLARIQAKLLVTNEFYQESTTHTVLFTSEKEPSEVDFILSSQTCGMRSIHLQSIKMQDYLGIFSWKKKMSLQKHLYIFPVPIFAMHISQAFEFDQGEVTYDPYRPGNDPSETFDIRPYQEGDPLHRIHHKLSYKLDKTMIREFSLPLEKDIEIVFELYGNQEDMDHILAQVYGFSLSLIDVQYRHTIKQYQQDVLVFSQVIVSRVDIDGFMKQILRIPISKQTEPSLSQSQSSEHLFYINKDGIQHEDMGVNAYETE